MEAGQMMTTLVPETITMAQTSMPNLTTRTKRAQEVVNRETHIGQWTNKILKGQKK